MRLSTSVPFLLLFGCQPELIELRAPGTSEPQAIGIDDAQPGVAPDLQQEAVAVYEPPIGLQPVPGSSKELAAEDLPISDVPTSKETPAAVRLDIPATSESHVCAKVDLIFVIDNSPSMDTQQDTLAREFPQFVAAMEEQLDVTDLHVMAVDTDEASLLDRLPLFGSTDACDETLGAGRRSDSLGRNCEVDMTKRFLSSTDQDAFENFDCVSSVGSTGRVFEEPVGAMLNAVSPAFNSPGGCNEGFVRDDAVLIVVLLTDEDDTGTDLDPGNWHDELFASRDEDGVVVLGLLGGGSSCELLPSAPAPRLVSFVESAKHGVVTDGCTKALKPFFAEAVNLLDQACYNFQEKQVGPQEL